MKTHLSIKNKHIEEIMSEKEGEKIAEENLQKATKAAVGSLDDPNRINKEGDGQGRASVA